MTRRSAHQRDRHGEAEAAHLWGRPAALRSAGLIAVGSIVWWVGWYRVAGEARTDDQTAPFNLAVIGVLIAGVGMVDWFLEGRRSVGLRRLALLGVSRPVRSRRSTPTSAPEAPALVSGTRYFHRTDCPIVSGRELPATTRTEYEADGRRPCGVCTP